MLEGQNRLTGGPYSTNIIFCLSQDTVVLLDLVITMVSFEKIPAVHYTMAASSSQDREH